MKVLKFGAIWCPGCLVMKPRWKEIEDERPWLKNEYHDFDEERGLAEKYRVTDILPVFIFLDKNGNEFLRLDGEIDKRKLVDIIEQNKDK